MAVCFCYKLKIKLRRETAKTVISFENSLQSHRVVHYTVIRNLTTFFEEVISYTTVKAAGKISNSQFSTTFLLKNPQTKLIIAQTGKTTWLQGS